MVETRPLVVDNLSGQNTEANRDNTRCVVMKSFLESLFIVMGKNGIEPLIEKGHNIAVEITDILVGPFELFPDPF